MHEGCAHLLLVVPAVCHTAAPEADGAVHGIVRGDEQPRVDKL
jgi:hypothetical protein